MIVIIRDSLEVSAPLDRIWDPSHTALVEWDVQNMLVSRIFNKEELTSNLSLVIGLARKAVVPIFFTRIQTLPMRFESSARVYTFNKLGFDRMREAAYRRRYSFCNKASTTK